MKRATRGHAATVLPTNAMIPPPHGFIPAEVSIGHKKNITFLGRELCRSLRQRRTAHVRFGSKADIGVKSAQCPLYPQKAKSRHRIVIRRVIFCKHRPDSSGLVVALASMALASVHSSQGL